MVSIRNDLKALCSECGSEMIKGDLVPRNCVRCGKEFVDDEVCINGHYVCEDCRKESASKVIYRICSESDSRDPIALAIQIMSDRRIRMHDIKHHVLVGACLLTAYKNSGGDIDLDKALRMMEKRGSWFPAGVCGLCGTCGAAASTGAFYSIITNSSPHSKGTWSESINMTSTSLARIAEIDGPRCCKRNSFLAIYNACDYVKEKFGVEMQPTKDVVCTFSDRNDECVGKACPFFTR